ncbi:MAG: N-acetylmuramoyl-L-alanine amidase [Desulfobacterales bacterium]
MPDNRKIKIFLTFGCLLLAMGLGLAFPPAGSAKVTGYSQKARSQFQQQIIDYRRHLHPRYPKKKRPQTRHIIVHTSECNLTSTLRTVSKGKRMHNGRRTYGGHAHYVIARNGKTYRTLDKAYRADHAGRSMWNGTVDISDHSIGIELVGYHYAPLSEAQYHSVGILIKILQRVYQLKDRDVLTHSQIAYGRPNRWIKHDHRGRKRCAKNFIRANAGLGPSWSYDPDVKARRLVADRQLAQVYYGHAASPARLQATNVVSKTNSPWAIAGEDYNLSTTVYQFPNGKILRGDQIDQQVGWQRIPPKTVILLNQESTQALAKQSGPVKTITNGLSAWVLAGKRYNQPSTIYFLPRGQIKKGNTIADWDDLPEDTQLIIGYRGPFEISASQYAAKIAGSKFKNRQTLYYFPEKRFIPGNKIEDFSRLPVGTLLFVPLS